MNPPGLIPFGVSVVERVCMNPPGLIPFGVPVLERRYTSVFLLFPSIKSMSSQILLLSGNVKTSQRPMRPLASIVLPRD